MPYNHDIIAQLAVRVYSKLLMVMVMIMISVVISLLYYSKEKQLKASLVM